MQVAGLWVYDTGLRMWSPDEFTVWLSTDLGVSNGSSTLGLSGTNQQAWSLKGIKGKGRLSA